MPKSSLCKEVFASTSSSEHSLGSCLDTNETALFRCLPDLAVPRTKSEIEAMTTKPLLFVRRKVVPSAESLSMPFSQRDRMVIRAFARQGSECPLLIYPCSEDEHKKIHGGNGTRSKPVSWKFVRMAKSSPDQDRQTPDLRKDAVMGGTRQQQSLSKQESAAHEESPPQPTIEYTRSRSPVLQLSKSNSAFATSHGNSFATSPIAPDYEAAMGPLSMFPGMENGVGFFHPVPGMDWATYGIYPSPVYDPAFHHAWAIICGNTSPFQPTTGWDVYGPANVHCSSPDSGETSYMSNTNSCSGQGYQPPVYEGNSG